LQFLLFYTFAAYFVKLYSSKGNEIEICYINSGGISINAVLQNEKKRFSYAAQLFGEQRSRKPRAERATALYYRQCIKPENEL